MIAYRLNECDVYAADSLEEAIQAAISDTGCTHDEIFDETYHEELSPDTQVKDDDDSFTTVGEILAGMNGPGFVCGYCG